MASWGEILDEMDFQGESVVDKTRKKYIEGLSKVTNRSTIIYYSAFLTKSFADNIDINDSDIEGFMAVMNGIDCSKGLDLVLHTPGGDPTAAESIVNYLKSKFGNDIRVIVPHLAMSAGTMIACCAKSIVMGNHSSLGPTDPQFGGIPAENIARDFFEAKREIKDDPANMPYWEMVLRKYPPSILRSVADAMSLSEKLVKDWLSANMYNNCNEVEKVNDIVEKLNDHGESKVHSRHYSKKFCKDIGLKIEDLEADQNLQDAVLSVHHTMTLTFARTSITKVIASSTGNSFIRTAERG